MDRYLIDRVRVGSYVKDLPYVSFLVRTDPSINWTHDAIENGQPTQVENLLQSISSLETSSQGRTPVWVHQLVFGECREIFSETPH